MTTQTQPLPVSTSPSRPPMSSPRIATIIAGVIFVLGGLGVGAVGGGLLALFDGDSTVSSGRHALSTPATALVSEVADIEDSAELASVVGEPRVSLSVDRRSAAKGVFVGIGPAADVDHYLAASPIDEVTDFEIDPFALDRTARHGTRRPAPPADQPFWVAQGSGRNAADLDWKVRDGDYRMVVMNADGSRGVRTAGSVGLEVPHLPTIAWVLMGSGLIFLLGGATAIVAAVVTRPGANG
jgi:hypothetical protein